MRSVSNPLLQLVPQRVRQLRSQLERRQWARTLALDVRGGPINDPPVPLARAERQRLQRVVPGEHFGPAFGGWQQRWFRVDVPAADRGDRRQRHLQWECEGETTVFIDGKPWAGLDIGHRTCPLPDDAATVWLDCSTWQTGILPPNTHPNAVRIGRYGLRFDSCRLRVRDVETWDALWDLDAFAQLMAVLLERDGVKSRDGFGHVQPIEACSPLLRLVLRRLDAACDAFVAAGVSGLRAALRELSGRLPAEAWQPVAALCGHAHLDVVWLWPEMATRRKAIHTFATIMRLMERYPEMTFVQSQPALYRSLVEDAPDLWREIEPRIRAGRWEVTGGFEVEPDNHLPCGEALARSLVHGQRHIAALRGAISKVCWLPDVFGYSAALPQILRLGGVEHFFTTKMTWSQVTRFPYNSFVWRGHDGSEVLAHLCPTNYNGTVDLRDVTHAVREHRQSDVHAEVLLPTGYGDGAGGVSEAMCERARRLGNLAGAPRARWTTGDAFFRRMQRVRSALPTFQGELYLEYHRGTYTTQSECKRIYRAAEIALQTHEAVRVACGGPPIAAAAWQRVAFAQFHDALPGSSIGIVYDELNRELEAVAASAQRAASRELARHHRGRQVIVFNPTPLPRTGLVEHDGRPHLVRVPPLAGVSLRAAAIEHPAVRATPRSLDNGMVRAEFDAAGQLAALWSDGQRCSLAGAAGFTLHHDQPASFDAWDIDHYTARSGEPVATPMSLQLAERGTLRGVLRGTAAIGSGSTLSVDYVLEAGARHLRIEARVGWRESNRLLKWHVPTAYRGRWARFGCAFGSIQRAQWPGGPSDEAQWEVPGSRWAAVTNDDGDGVALITEAKYGFACRDGDLAVSLLRSPSLPDPRADRGAHVIRWAIGRHREKSHDGEGNTAASADVLFAPWLVQRGAPSPGPFTWEAIGTLVPSWVLPCESGRGFIVRLHETSGAAGTARVRFTTAPRDVDVVDFLERRCGRSRRVDRSTYEVDYRPYQVVSLRVR